RGILNRGWRIVSDGTDWGAPRERLLGERLDSWKEIASYLDRSVRTVKRWEAVEGLPVRRHHHQHSSSVWAYKPELDAWILARQPQRLPGGVREQKPRYRARLSPATVQRLARRHWRRSARAAIILILIGVAYFVFQHAG